jgi:peptide/nickel transport system substrate-binding protein
MPSDKYIDEMSRRRLLRATGAIGAGGVAALAGCSGGDGGDGGDGEDGGDGGDGGGGRAVIAPATGPTTLDPQNHRETTTTTYLVHFYNGLVTRNQEMEIVPDIATEWSNPDNTTWEFTLREDVTFSNGEEFTAETVKYNLERVSGQLNDETLPIADLYTSIDTVEAVDDYTARVNLSSPDPLFLENQAGLLYVPKTYTEENGFDALNDDPVGTGPYALDTWERDEQMTMTARDDYFKEAAPLDTLEWQPRPEAASRLSGLTSGDVDLIRSVSPQSEGQVESSDTARLAKVESARSAALWLNMKQDVYGRDDAVFYDNPDLRKAVNYAIDTESIIENILAGNANQSHGWAPGDRYLGYNSDIEPYGHDPERARELRDQAGYDEDELSLTLLTPRERYPSGVATSEAIATMLGEVGIDVELDAIEFGQSATETQEGNIPGMMFAAWGNPTFNALEPYMALVNPGALFSLLPTNDQQDWVQTVKQNIETATQTADRDELDSILQESEQILHDNAAFAFLFQYIDVYGVSSDLEWQPRSDEVMFMYNASRE